jgi:hypothetical protein
MSIDAHTFISTWRSRLAAFLAFAAAVVIGILEAVLLGGLIAANV